MESSRSKSKLKGKGCAHNLCGVGGLEPQEIVFADLGQQRYPDKNWHDLSAKEQAELIREALKPEEHLLNPHSPYLRVWDIIILCALAFTAIVTPYEVAFLATELDPLFAFNCFIDVIFFKDLVMQFFLKVQVVTLQGSIWIRDKRRIRSRYLRTWFTIDLLSILPFNTIGLTEKNEDVQKLKVVRTVRMLRLLKIIRMFRASRIWQRWQDQLSISFASLHLVQFATILLVISHWMACLWGMTGILLCEDLKCNTEDLSKYEFLETQHGYSWLSSKGWGHHSPCRSGDVYLASLHFAVMTITSIGYGDITPTRNEEYIVGIICQLGGGLTWAFIIGSICGIISNANPTRVAYEHNLDALNVMLREQGVEFELCVALRKFVREKQYHDWFCQSRSLGDEFSRALQTRLIPQTIIGKAIQNIWYFNHADEGFIVDVAALLVPAQYTNQDLIGVPGVLHIVQRGSVARCGRILMAGCFWGEDMILSDQSLVDQRQGIALNDVEILSLSKNDFDQIRHKYPLMDSHVRKAATWIIFRIAVKTVAEEEKRGLMRSASRFSRAFTGIGASPECQLLSTHVHTRAKFAQRLLAKGTLDLHDVDQNTPVNLPCIAEDGESTAGESPVGAPIPTTFKGEIQDLSNQMAAQFKIIMREMDSMKEDLRSVKEMQARDKDSVAQQPQLTNGNLKERSKVIRCPAWMPVAIQCAQDEAVDDNSVERLAHLRPT